MRLRTPALGDEEMSDSPIVAVIGCGLLSPVLDSTDVRKPSRLNDWQFDAMVQSLFDQGRIAFDVLEVKFVQ